MMTTTDFLGFRFERGSREALFDRMVGMAQAPFGYVVTPNVDLVNRPRAMPRSAPCMTARRSIYATARS